MFSAYRSLTEVLLSAGQIRGRKKLQKMVFIAQSLGYPFAESFQMHMWGPYSESLAVKLKEMSEWGFAAETILPGPGGNAHYLYAPGPEAGRIAQKAGAKLADLIDLLNTKDATLLEGVATALFFRMQGIPEADVGVRLSRLKPDKFTHPVRREAVQQLVLELVRTRPVM